MLIKSYIGVSYVDEKIITSMTISEGYVPKDGKNEKVYMIHINGTYTPPDASLFFRTEELAKEALLEIHDKVIKNKNETSSNLPEQDNRDYINGFKDGCDYTLKLGIK